MTEAPPSPTRRRPSLRAAAILLFVHGLVEVVGVGLLATPAGARPEPWAHAPSSLIALGGLYGAARLVAAVGVWAGRTWAVALGILCGAITMAVAPVLQSLGVLDLLLALPVLVLLLGVWFGNGSIE